MEGEEQIGPNLDNDLSFGGISPLKKAPDLAVNDDRNASPLSWQWLKCAWKRFWSLFQLGTQKWK